MIVTSYLRSHTVGVTYNAKRHIGYCYWFESNTATSRAVRFHCIYKCLATSYKPSAYNSSGCRCMFFFYLVVMPRRKVRYPCSICEKACGNGTIECTQCKTWTHRRCCSLDESAFAEYSADNVPFFCRRCMGVADGGGFSYRCALQR